MNELTKEQKQDLWLNNNGISRDEWSALQNSVYPGAKPESILMVVNYCRARQLDPLKKPVHIVQMNVEDAKTKQKIWRDVIMPGIYEHRITAFKTGQMAGMEDPVFGGKIEHLGLSAPEFCKVTVYRMVNGVKCAFSHTEFFEEAVSTKKDGQPNAMWSKRPRGQLAKCAEAGALRKAFPDELGGVTTAEEAIEGSSTEVKVNKRSLEEELLG